MTATQNDGTAPIAVVAAFQLKGDAAEFEKILREQGELMLAGDGFQYGVLARATDSPTTYVSVAWWRDSMSYLSVVRSYAFASRAMSGVGRLADTRLDRLVPLTGDGSLLPPAGSDDAVLGLSEYTLDEGADAAAFEREAVAAGAVAGRSLVRAGGYTALTWGGDAAVWTPRGARATTVRYEPVSVSAPAAV
ncbi:antibiotic biosynthesis monooxygenase family protein [Streptomyces sp. NRRL F-5126]|uniref:antibiotic biosynthesis monooxygenase family protein n=1 Tax=Streptomyces sp. NRRL F-5126 TaxID=1463857 RepID=UPI0004C74E1D|nr:antibiotic biosynthesis monooxygenase family protein [Streptomyces sp. NRRL F-5126]